MRAADKDTAKPATAAELKNAEAALKQDMPAAAVLQLLGKPDEVRPMKTPTGKAEVWSYTRDLSVRVERVEVPTSPIMTTVVDSNGVARQVSSPGPVNYRNLNHTIEETVEVLMFNDRYVTHKITHQERQSYD